MDPKPKSTRTRKLASAASASRRAPAAGDPPAPTHEQIALRAHDLYVRSGCQPGREQEFWLEAERQLLNELKPLHV